MKRIFKNHDISFNLEVNNFPINFNLVKKIDFKFYTTTTLVYFSKTEKDVNKHNNIILPSQDLDKLNEGVLYYDYQVVLIDSVMPDQTFDTCGSVMSDYYLANGNHMDEPIDETKLMWGKISGDIEEQNDLMQKFAHYYSKEQVDQQIEDLVGGNINLKNYYTKQDIDDKHFLQAKDIEGKVDVSAYTEDMKDVALKTELEDYVTKTELVGKHYLTEHQNISHLATKSELANYQPVGNYLTSEQLDGKGYLTNTSLNGYAKITDIPTKVSELSNDAGYLTEHQPLNGYAKENWVNDQITKQININKADLSDFYHKHEVYNKAEIDNKGYLTQHQSLVNYALKGDIPTVTSQLRNDSGYITDSSLINYYTKDEVLRQLDEQLMGVDAPKLSNYYLKSETYNRDEINEAIKKGAASVDLSKFYTKQDIDGKGYLTEHQSLSHMLSKVEASQTYQPLGNYVTSEQLNSKGYLTDGSLVGYAKLGDIPTNTSELRNDSGFLTENSLSEYALKSWVTSEIDRKITGGEIDLSNYYTIQQIDNKGFLTSADLAGYATEEYVTNQITNTVDLANYYKKSETYSAQEIDNKFGELDRILDSINGEVI